jgi:hypothetical protein
LFILTITITEAHINCLDLILKINFKTFYMKSFFRILFLAVLTAGIYNCADAQRSESRSIGGSSGHSSGGYSPSPRGGSSSFSQSRASHENTVSRNNSYSAPQRSERIVPQQRANDNRIFAQRNTVERNAVVRNESRQFNNSSVSRNNNANRVASTPYNRNAAVSARYSGYTVNNYYHYNSRYYGGGYYNYNNRRYSFMYGPRYTFIPRNSISLYFGGYPYYYNDGFFYGYYSGFYQPIFPPFGIRVGILPYGYSRIFLGPDLFYYYNGIYYRQYDDNNYEVVDAPMGATVRSLPEGAKAVTINGEKMYELNGTYYKEGTNSKGKVIYTVVGKNGEVNNTENDNGDINTTPTPDNNNNTITAPNNSTNDQTTSLQMGDVVNELPQGSKTVTINGEKMYVTPDDTYLKQNSDSNGNAEYKVVGK